MVLRNENNMREYSTRQTKVSVCLWAMFLWNHSFPNSFHTEWLPSTNCTRDYIQCGLPPKLDRSRGLCFPMSRVDHGILIPNPPCPLDRPSYPQVIVFFFLFACPIDECRTCYTEYFPHIGQVKCILRHMHIIIILRIPPGTLRF